MQHSCYIGRRNDNRESLTVGLNLRGEITRRIPLGAPFGFNSPGIITGGECGRNHDENKGNFLNKHFRHSSGRCSFSFSSSSHSFYLIKRSTRNHQHSHAPTATRPISSKMLKWPIQRPFS